MILKLDFGYSGITRTIEWNAALMDFPKIISYDGSNWEWVTYDSDPSGNVDIIMLWSKLKPYDPRYAQYAVNLEDVLFEDKLDSSITGCECAAKFSSFPQIHSHWCKKYSKDFK